MKKLMQKMKDQAGLTLVELLAVIVILGILAAIAVPSILGIIQNTRIDAVKADAITVLNMAKLEVSSNAVKYEGATESKSITITGETLQSYLDGGAFKGKGSDFKVDVTKKSTGEMEYKLSTVEGKTIEANGKLFTFTNATIDNINNFDNKNGGTGITIADKK